MSVRQVSISFVIQVSSLFVFQFLSSNRVQHISGLWDDGPSTFFNSDHYQLAVWPPLQQLFSMSCYIFPLFFFFEGSSQEIFVVIFSSGFRKVWPIQSHFPQAISLQNGFCFVSLQRSWLVLFWPADFEDVSRHSLHVSRMSIHFIISPNIIFLGWPIEKWHESFLSHNAIMNRINSEFVVDKETYIHTNVCARSVWEFACRSSPSKIHLTIQFGCCCGCCCCFCTWRFT